MKLKVNDIELFWNNYPELSRLKYIDKENDIDDYIVIIVKQNEELYTATVYNYIEMKHLDNFFYIDNSNEVKDIEFNEETLEAIKFKAELQIIQWLKNAEDKIK